ncbi:MAG: hypothetical protein Q4A74_05670 [Cardiobacteriaceae bacterium]|nr:hypothetical protein [Cardiobacteriaceae bacterium]
MGFPRDSLVTATAYWLLVNWDIVHGTESTSAQNQAVYQQILEYYAQDTTIAELSDSEKQTAAEAMLWFAALQYELYQETLKSGDTAKINASLMMLVQD